MRLRAFVIASCGLAMIGTNSVAAEDVETTIMKCRTNSLSAGEQITCLENALRDVKPAGEKPDWAGIGTIGQTTPAAPQSGGIAVARPSGLGSEQVVLEGEARERADKEFKSTEQSTVIDFAYNQNQKLILVLGNGQVWIQNTSDRASVRLQTGDQPQVTIRRGAVSGYRMEFPTYDRTIIVRRFK